MTSGVASRVGIVLALNVSFGEAPTRLFIPSDGGRRAC
jgi:hypothetical protein